MHCDRRGDKKNRGQGHTRHHRDKKIESEKKTRVSEAERETNTRTRRQDTGRKTATATPS
eukprot:182074-Rhodomonas_salina.1